MMRRIMNSIVTLIVVLLCSVLSSYAQETKYVTGGENRLDVLLQSLYDAVSSDSGKVLVEDKLTFIPTNVDESYSQDGLKQILSFTPSAERTSGILMTDVANILRDAQSYSATRVAELLINLRDSQSSVDAEVARVSKAQFQKCAAALKYYESASDSLRNRIEEAQSPDAGFEPSDTDTHMMDKSMHELARRIETIDTVSSEYDRVAKLHQKASMTVLEDAIEEIRKLTEVAEASVRGPREGQSVQDLEDSVISSTGGAGVEEVPFDELALLELSGPNVKALRSIHEMQDNLLNVQNSLMKDTRELTKVDDVVVPVVKLPVPSTEEIETIVSSDKKSSATRLEIDQKLLKDLLQRKDHLDMLCKSLNETSRRFERDVNMSDTFGIVPETFPHVASHVIIADLGRLADYVSNHTDLVIENETMSDAFVRAVPLMAKEIRSAVISSSSGKEPLRSVKILICVHQVRSGDSLPSLAEKYDLSLHDLKDANPQLPWKLRHENGYPDIGTTVFVPFDHHKPCEKLYPCAISPSPVCSHGGIASRGPEGTKPGYGWLHTSLGSMAAKWAVDAATGSAVGDWDADSDLVSRAESSALERVAEAGERTSRLFGNVRENIQASGKDVIATSGLTPAPLSGMPVDSLKQLDSDRKKGPVPHDILAADSSSFLEILSKKQGKKVLRKKQGKKRRGGLRGSNDVLSKGDAVWVYKASAEEWESGTVLESHEDQTYEVEFSDGRTSDRVPIEGISTSEPSTTNDAASTRTPRGTVDISSAEIACDTSSGPESSNCPEVTEECDFSNAGNGCEIVTEYVLSGTMCCPIPCNFKNIDGESCGGNIVSTDSLDDDDVAVAGIFDGALCDDLNEPCPSKGLGCSGHGSIAIVEDSKQCRCDDGYEGENCDKCASSHYEEEAIPSNHPRGYDKTRKICRRCAPFITVNRADGHQYEGAVLEVSTSCDVAAQVVTSVGGSGAGLWAQRDKLKVKYADLFLSVEGSNPDLTGSARVEIHEFSAAFPSGELQTDDALAVGYFNNTSEEGWSRFTFLPYAPISAGIDVVLALRLKSSDDTKIDWHRDDRVDLSDKAAKSYMHCLGSWDEAEVLDGMDQPQFSYRLVACSG